MSGDAWLNFSQLARVWIRTADACHQELFMQDMRRSSDASDDVRQQLEVLQRETHALRWVAAGAIALSVVSLAWTAAWVRAAPVRAAASNDGILRVRGLIVEDGNGVERVRLGAPLPDPMGTDGVRHHRQGVISGMLISDGKGTERGGYVTADTSDEAFFSLDSRKGQELLFLANPNGGTNLDLFDKLGNEAQLTVFPDGPKFVMKRKKQVVARIPESHEAAK